MPRIQLVVTVDLADSGELSTASDWQQFLQRQMVDLAGYFRPVVVAQVPIPTPLGGPTAGANRIR